MNEHGVMYIASRDPYVAESIRSAKSVRKHHPDISIVLYTCADVESSVFDNVYELDNPEHDFSDSNLTGDKIPFNRTLFLDSDTYVCGSLNPVFEVLDNYDVAAAQDPTRTGTVEHKHNHSVPECYPQYNTGVIGFRDTESVRRLFAVWNEIYTNTEGFAYGLNQPSFRMAAYESDATIATLPSEWNYRWGITGNNVGYACGEIRVLHGRSPYWNLSDLESSVNQTDARRAVVIGKRDAHITTQNDAKMDNKLSNLVERAYWKRQTDGIIGLGRGAARTVMGIDK